jgi:1,4-dihydroxy-6-naphthoate synthase
VGAGPVIRLRVGISPCPNDTFVFHGLLSGEVTVPGVELDFTLADVELLNRGAAEGRFDLCKVSLAAALELGREHLLLDCGAALGRGVGPLVLRRPGESPWRGREDRRRVLVPGERTTACLLWRGLHPGEGQLESCLFSEIPPRLRAGEASLGVCIHEARFTYRALGLECFEDLGQTFEDRTDGPLPLGGLVARRELGTQLLAALQRGVRRSLARARAEPQRALATMRAHAQEQQDRVLWQHVELYVNAWTESLGGSGRRAIAALEELRRAVRGAAADAPLEILAADAG